MTHPWHQNVRWPDFLQPLSCADDLVHPHVRAQHRDLAQERAGVPADPSQDIEGCPHQVRLAFGGTVSTDTVFDALTWRHIADALLTWPLAWGNLPQDMSDAMQQELALVRTLMRTPDVARAWAIHDDFSVDVLDAIVARGWCVALRAALASPTCPNLENLQSRHGQASVGFKHPRPMPWLHAAVAMDSPLATVLLEHGFDPCQRDQKGLPAWTLASSAAMLDHVLAHIHAPLSLEDLKAGLLQWANGPAKSTYIQRVEVLQRHAQRWHQPASDLDVAQALVLVQRRSTPVRSDGALDWVGADVTASHLLSLPAQVWRTPVVEPSWPLEDKRMTLADAVAWRTMSESYPSSKYGVAQALAGLPADVHSTHISGQVPGLMLRHTVMLVEKAADSGFLRDIDWSLGVVPALSGLLRTPADARRGPGLHLPGLAKTLGSWAHTWKMADKINPATWDAVHEVVQHTGMDLSQASDAWVACAMAGAQSPRLTHEGACAMGQALVALFNNMKIESDYGIDKLKRKESLNVLDVLLDMEPRVPALAHPRLSVVVEALVAERDDAADWEGLKVRLRARALEGQWPANTTHRSSGARL